MNKIMSKIQIDIPEEFYKKLKKQAAEHCQSLRKYALYNLIQLADNKLKYVTEGSVITTKTTTTPSLTPEEIEEQKKDKFLKKCRQVLGEKTYKDWEPDIVREFIILLPDNSYYDYAERIQGRGVRMAYSMPEDKQDEYITDIKEYIDHEEGR